MSKNNVEQAGKGLNSFLPFKTFQSGYIESTTGLRTRSNFIRVQPILASSSSLI